MPPAPRLILISGWAHDASAMEDLRQCLEHTADVSAVSTGDLWSAEMAADPVARHQAPPERFAQASSVARNSADFQDRRTPCGATIVKTGIHTPSSYAQGLAKLIKKNAGQVFIAGWSLGGMIALETAAYRPDLVAGLILISSTAKFRAAQNWTSGVSPGALRAMTNMLKRDPRNVLATFFKNVAHTLEDKAQLLRTKAGNRGAFPGRARAGIQRLEEAIALKIEKACAMNPLELSAGLEYLSETDLREEATRVNIPALILHGKQDAIIPVAAGLALKSLLPVSKIRVYENFGHGLPWQNSRAIAEDIMGFVEECRTTNTKQAHR